MILFHFIFNMSHAFKRNAYMHTCFTSRHQYDDEYIIFEFYRSMKHLWLSVKWQSSSNINFLMRFICSDCKTSSWNNFSHFFINNFAIFFSPYDVFIFIINNFLLNMFLYIYMYSFPIFLLQLNLVIMIHADIRLDMFQNFVWLPINQKNWKIELQISISSYVECHRQQLN